ncbi:hypothetical protein PFISCL1PPCAC_12154, partial [Pristionchus fissidentatus]
LFQWLLDLFLWLCRGKTARQTQVPKQFSVDNQAIRIKGENNAFSSGWVDHSTGKGIYLNEYPHEGVKTLYDVFLRSVKVYGKKDCLGERKNDGPYEFEDYETIHKKARAFGSTLVGKLGLKPSNSTNVGIYSRNCARWFISALGATSQSMAIVPLYDTLGADAAEFIINQAEIEVVVVDKAEKAVRLLEIRQRLPSLRHIVVIFENELTEEIREKGAQAGLVVHKFSEIIEEGERNPKPDVKPSEDDIYIISYTSGTTGTPKGVMLTHRNLLVGVLTTVQSILDTFVPGYFGQDEVLLSFLPLSHMIEQNSHWVMMHFGGAIGYYRGDITKLSEDMQSLKPTFLPLVPRLMNRIYDNVMAKVNSASFIVRALFELAKWAKLTDLLRHGIFQSDSIWDKIVFGKIRALIGGRVKFVLFGSAPIADEVLQTLRAAFGCVMLEVYGLTESTAVACVTWPADSRPGHCGGPASCTLIKLEDVPDMNYFAAEGKGEVLLKGTSITKGYYKEPQKTAELFDEDGCMRTGDIGWLRKDGTLKLIDRKKNIFKLAQGEYVAPEKIEQIYARAPLVQQVYVDGNSLERWLIAVVVPETAALQEWDELENGQKRTIEEICKDTKTAEHVLSTMVKIGKENKLNSIEQVKKVILESDPFSVENGLLTPTLKAKRPQLRIKYAEAMAAVYKANANL